MKHPREEALLECVEVPDPQIAAHVTSCNSCARIIEEYRSLTTSLSDSTTWMMPATGQSGLEARETALRREEQKADELLASLESRPVAWWKAHLPAHPGTARSLLRHAHDRLEVNPQRACEIADLALELTDRIGDEQEQHHLRGWAHRERANALRYLGRYQEAFQALNTAEAHFLELPIGDFDMASVLYIRAGLLREQRHLTEARNAARESARLFGIFGQKIRKTHALLVLANIEYDDGQFSRAREQYEALLRAPALRGNDLTLARVNHNLGSTLTQLGEHVKARKHLKNAQKTYSDLGRQTELARVQWALARNTAAAGEASDAENDLSLAIAMLSVHGMRVDAALARLDLAELLLERGDPQGAHALCAPIIEGLQAAGMSVPAAEAMDMLRRASSPDRLTLALVRETRLMIQQLAPS